MCFLDVVGVELRRVEDWRARCVKCRMLLPARISAKPCGGFATVKIAESVAATSNTGIKSSQRVEGCHLSVVPASLNVIVSVSCNTNLSVFDRYVVITSPDRYI